MSDNGTTRDRMRANEDLLANARRVSREQEDRVSAWPGLVRAQAPSAECFVPGYIPFIGRSYFCPGLEGQRILVYALSQNLSPSDECGIEWAFDWNKGNGSLALDRQNTAFDKLGIAMMLPFDTGHIPVTCALLRSLLPRRLGERHSIYDEIAATNLSKWSFRKETMTTDSTESFKHCWEWFSVEELRILRPNFVVVCAVPGSPAFQVVATGLKGLRAKEGYVPRMLWVPFASGRTINRWFGQSRGTHPTVTLEAVLCSLTADDRARLVKRGSNSWLSLEQRVRQDLYYFGEVYETLRVQLAETS